MSRYSTLSRRSFVRLLGVSVASAVLGGCAGEPVPAPARVTLGGGSGVFPLTGEWTCFRANGALDGYALGKGLASRPAIAWRQQVGRTETLLVVEPGGGSETISLPGEVTANGLDEARDARWGYTPATAEFGDDRVSLANTSTTTYAHVLPDEPGLQKLEFGDSFGTGEPVGRCYAWRDGRWEQVWETEPVQLAFSPRPIAGDFDGDGNVEVAILPWDLLWIFDGQTGHLEERCALSGGRNYGFYGAYDLDGDGKSEFVVLADFAKHVDVIGYRSGALERLWNLDVELGIQDPQKVLRVNPNPVADVDGDGKLEVLVSLWDGHDDGRWHVTVHDGMTGAIKHDLADELLQGVVDVTGDGVSELLTVRTVGRNASPYGAVMVRSCRGEGVTTLWEREGAAWQTWDRPLPLNVNSGATLGQRDVLWREIAERARVVLAQTAPATSDSVFLSVLEWGESGLEPVVEIAGPALEALGMDEEGNLLLSSGTLPGASGSVVIGSGRGRVLAARPRRDVPGPVIVGRSPGTDWPVIVAQGGGEEMVAFHAPADGDEQGTELWRHQGWGQGINWYWGTWHPLADGWESPPSAAVKNQVLGPVLVDLSGDGGRQCLYATVAPTGCARLEAVDLVTGDVVWRHDLSDLPGTIPIWNTGGILLWRAGRFTDLEKQDVVLTVRRGIMHSEEIRMLRGRDGSQLWRRQRQSTYEDGIGGVLTVADYTGDGLDEVLSYYSSSKEIYNVLRGETGEDVRCWVQGIAPCANYDGAIGIAGDMLGDGETSLFLANTVTGLATRGDLMVWATGRSDSPKCLPAFGDLDGDGRLEAVVVENAEGFDVVCYDVAGGEVEWRLPALAETAPAGSASADVDGDGRDEALFVVDKTLYCFGLPRREVQGALLWQIDLPAAVGPPTVADVDGDGRLSILLAGSDGYVYCVR